MRLAGPERLAAGDYTASAGNMAQGVAWSARRLGAGGAKKVVCIVSGGNIDAAKLCTILDGRVP